MLLHLPWPPCAIPAPLQELADRETALAGKESRLAAQHAELAERGAALEAAKSRLEADRRALEQREESLQQAQAEVGAGRTAAATPGLAGWARSGSRSLPVCGTRHLASCPVTSLVAACSSLASVFSPTPTPTPPTPPVQVRKARTNLELASSELDDRQKRTAHKEARAGDLEAQVGMGGWGLRSNSGNAWWKANMQGGWQPGRATERRQAPRAWLRRRPRSRCT